jgi:hypothetical protein
MYIYEHIWEHHKELQIERERETSKIHSLWYLLTNKISRVGKKRGKLIFSLSFVRNKTKLVRVCISSNCN